MGFQVMAILILLIFYGCYFSKMIIQKKKGIQTDQIGKGKKKKGFIRFIEMTMKTASFLVLVIEMISIGLNITCLPVWIRCVGTAAASAGSIIFISSVVTMRDNWRAGVPESDKTELVTDGIYQISRNPAFVGFDLIYLGILLMFFNWILFAVSLFAVVMFHLQIVNVEEEFLLNVFGGEYLDYKKKVNRYLGRRTV